MIYRYIMIGMIYSKNDNEIHKHNILVLPVELYHKKIYIIWHLRSAHKKHRHCERFYFWQRCRQNKLRTSFANFWFLLQKSVHFSPITGTFSLHIYSMTPFFKSKSLTPSAKIKISHAFSRERLSTRNSAHCCFRVSAPYLSLSIYNCTAVSTVNSRSSPVYKHLRNCGKKVASLSSISTRSIWPSIMSPWNMEEKTFDRQQRMFLWALMVWSPHINSTSWFVPSSSSLTKSVEVRSSKKRASRYGGVWIDLSSERDKRLIS